MRTRGHEDWADITAWPKNEHYRLTTGAESGGLGAPVPVRLNEAEKQMCAILGLNELELGIFLKSWEPDALRWPHKTERPTEKIIRRYLKIDDVDYKPNKAHESL
jgi:hypothetical protein